MTFTGTDDEVAIQQAIIAIAFGCGEVGSDFIALDATPVVAWLSGAGESEWKRLVESTPIKTPGTEVVVFRRPVVSPESREQELFTYLVSCSDDRFVAIPLTHAPDYDRTLQSEPPDWRPPGDEVHAEVDSRGLLIPGTLEVGMQTPQWRAAVVLTVAAMMNVRNIAMVERPVSRTARRRLARREARAALGDVRYKTLVLTPFQPNAPKSSGDRRPAYVPLHLVRGHFVNYTEERPMFGNKEHGVGTFWCPTHARGRAEFGEVRKSYTFDLEPESA